MKDKLRVSAALIWDDAGSRFMICRRPENKARGGLWEFVGGKAEAGESGEEALVRECREELDIEVSADKLFMETVHDYPDVTVDLFVYSCRIISGEPKLLEHQDMQWIRPAEIGEYDFCPADEAVLKKIKELKTE